MFNSEHWNYNGVKFIEFYGLRRSGNRAILTWLLKNLSSYDSEIETLIEPVPELGFVSKRCGDAYHINDVGSNWSVGNPDYLAGLIDAYISMGAKAIVLSYEEYAPEVSLLHTFPDKFNFLKDSKKIGLIRDLPNVLASRYKAIQKIGPDKVSFGIDVYKINSWIKTVIGPEFKIKYEDWLTSKEHRDQICKELQIPNRDVTNHVSNAGGGSSFSGISLPNTDRLLNRYKEVNLPKEWSFYLETVEVIRARKTAGYIKPKEGAIHIKVIGDSHTAIFDGYTGDEYFFDQTRVHGATARGSANPKTKTNSLEQFRKGLSGKKADRVIIGLGEVDCGYLIWYRNKHKGISIKQSMKDSMDGLLTFIKNEVRPIYEPSEIIILSSIPPIVEDNTSPKFLEGRRAEVNPSMEQRLNLTNEWNKVLFEKCNDLGYSFINMNSEISDSNGRVLKKYRNPDVWNHHLWESSTIQVMLHKLNELGI